MSSSSSNNKVIKSRKNLLHHDRTMSGTGNYNNIKRVFNKCTLILWLPHMNAWIQEYLPLSEKLCLLVLRLTFYLNIYQQSCINQGHVTNGSPCLVEWKSRNIRYQVYTMLRSFSFLTKVWPWQRDWIFGGEGKKRKKKETRECQSNECKFYSL